jgi:hypothetical protein
VDVLDDTLQIAGAIVGLCWLMLGVFAIALYVTTLNAERRAAEMAQQLLRETSRFLEASSRSA